MRWRCRFRKPGMGRKKEMVHGDVFAYLIFFSYIEDKPGRPLGLGRSRKPFWREFDEYMRERGKVIQPRQSVTTQARVSVRNTMSGSVSAVFRFCFSARDLVVFFFFLHTYTHTHTLIIFSHTLYVAPLNACASRSAGSVGTESIRNVFVCPRPPFQPCTAMIVQPGLIKPKATALRNPNLMRLST